MTNLQDKIDNIISELEFVKNNIKRSVTITEFCHSFRLALISKLEQTGATYDPTLEFEWSATSNNTTDKKKFFAFKKSDIPTEREILDRLKWLYGALVEYMIQVGDLKNLYFNILKFEGLRDRAAFSDLIRGILVVKEVDNAR